MGRQLYPYAQVGRPANRVTARWNVLDIRRCKLSYVGLIERSRTSIDLTDTSYAVVFSRNPILPNGTLLRTLYAIPYRSGPKCKRPCKAANPKAWHSNLGDAEGKFRALVRRGGWR